MNLNQPNRKPSKQILQLVAVNIRRKREEKGWVPKQLAGICGCPLSVVYRLEQGSPRNSIALATLEIFSRALGCETWELIAPTSEHPK